MRRPCAGVPVLTWDPQPEASDDLAVIGTGIQGCQLHMVNDANNRIWSGTNARLATSANATAVTGAPETPVAGRKQICVKGVALLSNAEVVETQEQCRTET